MTYRLCAALAAALAASGGLASAPPEPQQSERNTSTPFVLGTRHTLHSEAMDQARAFRVWTPEGEWGYSRYPVLYVLDAAENFVSAVGLSENLARAGTIPPMIVVGIENSHRFYEMTTYDPDIQGRRTGGADDTIRFIDEELSAFLSDNYSASSHATIVSHSLGGVLVNRALATHPTLANAYISISPSTWWGDKGLDDALQAAWVGPDALPRPGTVLALSLADEDPEDAAGMRSGYAELEAYLSSMPENALRWRSKHYRNLNHISTYIPALSDGLAFVFDAWRFADDLDRNDTSQIIQHCESVAAEFGFAVPPPSEMEFAIAARALTQDGRPAEAISALEWLLQFYPSSVPGHNFLGEAHQTAGSYERALAVYTRSLDIAKSQGSPMVGWIENRMNDCRTQLDANQE